MDKIKVIVAIFLVSVGIFFLNSQKTYQIWDYLKASLNYLLEQDLFVQEDWWWMLLCIVLRMVLHSGVVYVNPTMNNGTDPRMEYQRVVHNYLIVLQLLTSLDNGYPFRPSSDPEDASNEDEELPDHQSDWTSSSVYDIESIRSLDLSERPVPGIFFRSQSTPPGM